MLMSRVPLCVIVAVEDAIMHNVQQGLLQLDGRAIRVLQLCGRARHEVDRIAPVPGILNAKCHDLG